MRLMHWLRKFSDAELLSCHKADMTAKEAAARLHTSVQTVLTRARALHVAFRRGHAWSEADDAVIRAWAAGTLGGGAARVQLAVGMTTLRQRAAQLGVKPPRSPPPAACPSQEPIGGRTARPRRDRLLEKLHEVYGASPQTKPAAPW